MEDQRRLGANEEYRQFLKHYEPNNQEKEVLRNCNSLALIRSTIGAIAGSMFVGFLARVTKSQSKGFWGPTYVVGSLAGLWLGTVSAKNNCAKKLASLPDSPLASKMAQLKGNKSASIYGDKEFSQGNYESDQQQEHHYEDNLQFNKNDSPSNSASSSHSSTFSKSTLPQTRSKQELPSPPPSPSVSSRPTQSSSTSSTSVSNPKTNPNDRYITREELWQRNHKGDVDADEETGRDQDPFKFKSSNEDRDEEDSLKQAAKRGKGAAPYARNKPAGSNSGDSFVTYEELRRKNRQEAYPDGYKEL